MCYEIFQRNGAQQIGFPCSDTSFLSQIHSQTLFALPKSKPIQLFSVVSKFLHKGKALVNLMAFRIKLMTVLEAFKAQDFQRVSCSGKHALLTVSSCKATALKRVSWNNC
jgi:hypothetical protein